MMNTCGQSSGGGGGAVKIGEKAARRLSKLRCAREKHVYGNVSSEQTDG